VEKFFAPSVSKESNPTGPASPLPKVSCTLRSKTLSGLTRRRVFSMKARRMSLLQSLNCRWPVDPDEYVRLQTIPRAFVMWRPDGKVYISLGQPHNVAAPKLWHDLSGPMAFAGIIFAFKPGWHRPGEVLHSGCFR